MAVAGFATIALSRAAPGSDAWGPGCLAESCSANTLGEFFR